jgi:hypothetical protein
MDNHEAFEEKELKSGYIKDSKKIIIIRAFNLFVVAFDYGTQVVGNISHLGHLFAAYRFFTIWGITFTLITNILAQF